jgi:hypothetical protein
MNYKTRIRVRLFLLLAALTLAVAACQNKKPPAEDAPLPADRIAPSSVAPSPVGTNQTILHKTFTVKSSAIFPFEIPPRAVRPHLHGIFESFVSQLHGTSRGASDDEANLDFLILNAEQYADFASDRPGDAIFSAEASHNQSINVDLPASLGQPVKYYLVFRSSAGKAPAKVVEADFQLDF